MPYPLPPTPWIHGPNEAESYATGWQLGVHQQNLQNELVKIQQEQMRLQAAQELAQQNRLMEQQKIDIANQYHQQYMSLQNQKLEEAKRMNTEKIAQFARQAAIKMQITQRIQAGENPSQVWMEMGAQAGMPLSGIPSLAAHLPRSMEERPYIYTDENGNQWVRQPNGDWNQARKDVKNADPYKNTLLNADLKNVAEIQKQVWLYPDREDLKEQLQEAKQSVNDRLIDLGEPAKFVEQYISTLPKDKRGPATIETSSPSSKSSGVRLLNLEKVSDASAPNNQVKASAPSKPTPKTVSDQSMLDDTIDYSNEAARQVIGKLNKTSIVKGLWEINEALASMADIPFNTNLRQRVKKLSEDIMDATE